VDDAWESWYTEKEPDQIEDNLEKAWIYVTATPWHRFVDEFDQLMQHDMEKRNHHLERWRYEHGDLEIGDDPLDRGDVRNPDSIEDLFCDECHELNWSVGVKGEAHYCGSCWNELGLKDQEGLTSFQEDDLPVYALVGCGAAKNSGQLPAREKYSSTYSTKKREFAEELTDEWWILSAKYGVVEPNTVIDDYDVSMGDVDVDEWLPRVRESLREDTPITDSGGQLWVLVGLKYLDAETSSGSSLRGFLDRSDVGVRYPFGETSGIGEQNQYLGLAVDEGRAVMPTYFDEFQEETGQSELHDF
jgi:hypothetical protein